MWSYDFYNYGHVEHIIPYVIIHTIICMTTHDGHITIDMTHDLYLP
jgi:hypothetical protein